MRPRACSLLVLIALLCAPTAWPQDRPAGQSAGATAPASQAPSAQILADPAHDAEPAGPPAPRPPARPAAATPAPISPPAPAVSQADARQALDVLKDDTRRAEFIATLETIAKAAPAAEAKSSPIPLAPDSLGAQVLVSVSSFADQARAQIVASVGTVRSLPSLARWAETIVTDPLASARLIDTAWRLAVAMLCGLAAEQLALRLVGRPIRALATRAPAGQQTPATTEEGEPDRTRRRRASPLIMLRRIPFVLGRLLLDLLPVVVFGIVAHVVTAAALAEVLATQAVLFAVIDAYVVCRLVMCVARMVFAPGTPRLRLVHMSDASAAYVVRWLRRLVAVAVFGYALAEVGLLFGLSAVAHQALLKGVALIDHVLLGVMVVQKRRAVKHWIQAPEGASGAAAALRHRLSVVWHWIALFYISALWIVWAIEIKDGYTRMLHAFVFTAGVMIVTRLVLILALGALDKAVRPRLEAADGYPALNQRLATYHPILRGAIYGVVAAAGALMLLQVWGVGALAFLTSNQLGHQIISAVVTIALTLAAAVLVWEAANAGVQREIARFTLQSQPARAARLRTLLPMLRTALLLTILTVVVLMVLSEIGINIAPLLAGAGVLGIAVGFGSQKLVQDVITGLFLLLENTMQVGDIVSLGGMTGVVENLSIRAIRLRAEDGSVHVIPFSAVTTVTNMTRDYSHAVIEAQIAYDDDYDAVVAKLREIVRDMRSETRWATEIMDDLEVWGINKFADNAVVIKCRIKCGPFGRWAVGREFNRRMKQSFEGRGGPDAMRLLLPVSAAASPSPPAHQVAEPSPEAKLSAEAKKADAQQSAARHAADQEMAREDARHAEQAAREAAE